MPGTLTAYDATTGAEVWTWSDKDSYYSTTPVLAWDESSAVVAVSFTCENACTSIWWAGVDAMTGEVAWKTEVSLNGTVAVPVGFQAANATLYTVDADEASRADLVSIDGLTGDVNWRLGLPTNTTDFPGLAVDATGSLVVVSARGTGQAANLVGVNTEERVVAWQMAGVDSDTPGTAGGYVFTSTDTRDFSAFEAGNGAPLWSFATDGFTVETVPTLDPETGVVYCASHGGTVYAIKAETGDLVWNTTVVPDPGALYTVALSGNGMLVVGASTGQAGADGADNWTVFAFNATTGDQVWRLQAGTGAEPAPIMLPERLVVVTYGGVAAFEIPTADKEGKLSGLALGLILGSAGFIVLGGVGFGLFLYCRGRKGRRGKYSNIPSEK